MNCLELATQPREIRAARLQHLDDGRRIEQREQQVLDRDELVALVRARAETPRSDSIRARFDNISGLFHGAKQWMLVLLCEARDLRDFRLRDLVGIHPADAFSLRMNLQHDPGRRRPIQRKHLLEHLNDELHRSVIVVQQY